MKKAILYKKLKDNSVKCLACSWYCRITPNNTGVCGTRLNINGNLHSLVYGKAIGLHLDPVEKKPLHHFLPNSKILSFGTVGCNFGCLFCQNWEMSQVNKYYELRNKNYEENLQSLIDTMSTTITPKEIVAMAIKEGAQGIAYTYNEPAIFVEYTKDTAVLAKKSGLKNIYVSNGFESKETFEFVKDYIDAINIDLKSYRNEFYQKICKAKIEPVKENIKRFFNAGIETEITTLIIPGLNDSNNELKEIAKFLVSISTNLPWHISVFYPSYRMMNVPQTPKEIIFLAYEIGKKAGLKYVYAGNILDKERSSTYCPKCHQLLILRIGYNINIVGLDPKKGCCRKCQEKIYGKWN